MMKPRTIAPIARDLFSRYPVLTITGPRQSGKTTLARNLFPEKPYVNFERPDTREFFESDPVRFMARYPDGAIFDEIQRVPELTSWIQVLSDEKQRNSLYVLTGSTQFDMMDRVNQSLAGRTALLRLLPFSFEELGTSPGDNPDELMRMGFYPRIQTQSLDPTQFYADYIQTYFERDLRQILEIRNLSLFQRFLRLCAGRTGQLLNRDSLGADTGVSGVTVGHWLSVLEASSIIYLLQPWHANIGKRLIKSPKLYFCDTGLAAWLCGIETLSHVTAHPLRGSLFENMIIMDMLKHRYNRGKTGNFHFFRDSGGMEVDLLYPDGSRFLPVEIKSGQTLNESSFTNLAKIREWLPDYCDKGLLVYGGQETQERSAGTAVPWADCYRKLPG
jgi:predicted AAA+ superfamily ATPase